jgi:hypothetical protein
MMAQPTFPYRNGTATSKGGVVQPYADQNVLNPYGNTAHPSGTRVSFQFWQQPVYQNNDGTLWCPGFDGPTYASSAWDYIYIGLPTSGQPFTPGIATVSVDTATDMDKKKAAGTDGARVTFHGRNPSAVDIELKIWTPEQLRQFGILWQTLYPAAYKGTPPAFAVQHPMFKSELHNISSLQFIGINGPVIGHDRVGTFRIRAIQYLKPGTNKATKTAVAPIGSLFDAGAAPTISTPGASGSNTGP